MKKIRWITGILSIVCLLYFVVTGTDVLTVYGASDGSVTYVVDQADILSPQEEQAIETRIEEMSQKWKQDFVVVTTNDAEGKDSEEYADDYYDYHGYQENGVLYLVDLDNGNVWISTSGSMIRFLTDSRIDRVIDAGYSELKSKNYGEGFLAMLDQTEDYMEESTREPSNSTCISLRRMISPSNADANATGISIFVILILISRASRDVALNLLTSS